MPTTPNSVRMENKNRAFFERGVVSYVDMQPVITIHLHAKDVATTESGANCWNAFATLAGPALARLEPDDAIRKA